MSIKAQDDDQLHVRLVEMIAEGAVDAGADPAEIVDHFLRMVDDRTQEIGRQLVADLIEEIAGKRQATPGSSAP